MTKREKIIQWLKDHNVFEQFCKYASGKTMYLTDTLMYNLSWNQTSEGFDFWHRISEEYREWYYEQFPDEFCMYKF